MRLLKILPGENLNEIEYLTQYKILKKLAVGGMGNIYLAEQKGAQNFRKIVAIKAIRKEALTSKDNINLFTGEAKLVADLIHENILQVYQLGEIESTFYIVMEYANGIDLLDLIEKHQNSNQIMDVEMAAFICSRVARALYYAHTAKDIYGNSLNIVHRDVSPGNIMITYGGVIKLADFGIAKAVNMVTPDEKEILMGKLSYMSPEQAKFEGTTPLSDVFSLGLILYEITTGITVYQVEEWEELLEQMTKYDIAPPGQINPKIPDALEKIILKALSVDPKGRFQSAREFSTALEEYMYNKGYGPTNEKLTEYMKAFYPEKNFDYAILKK